MSEMFGRNSNETERRFFKTRKLGRNIRANIWHMALAFSCGPVFKLVQFLSITLQRNTETKLSLEVSEIEDDVIGPARCCHH